MANKRNQGNLVTVSQAAKRFGVIPSTIRKWRQRFGDFPEPAIVLNPSYNLYNMGELWDWYIVKWPERVDQLQVHLHRFVLDETGLTDTHSSQFGFACEARGYLKAVRDFEYKDWKVWSTGMGFMAEKDSKTHLWALDVSEEPEDWFIYSQRYKTAARRET